MRDDQSIPRQYAEEFSRRLARFLGRKLDGQALYDIAVTVRDTTTEFRLKGIKLPEMTAIILERTGHIILARADAEHDDIQQRIRNIAIQWPWLLAGEIAEAIRRAYPDYNPDKGRAMQRLRTIRDGAPVRA